MLATLLQALGSGDPQALQHTLAQQVAKTVATQGGQEPNVDPRVRMRTEELGKVASLHVSEHTEIAVASDGRPFVVEAISRGDWAEGTIERIEPLLAEIAKATAGKGLMPGGPGSAGSTNPSANDDEPGAGGSGLGPSELESPPEDAPSQGAFGLPSSDSGRLSPFANLFPASGPGQGEGLPSGLGGLFGPFSSLIGRAAEMFGPTLLALQAGGLVGELAGVAMSGAELAVPKAPSHQGSIVALNVSSFAEAWDIPLDDALLWVAISELSRHALLDRPSVRTRLLARLHAHAESYAEVQSDLARRVEELDLADPSELGRVLSDPSLLFGTEPPPAQQRAAEAVRAATAALDAAAASIARTVGARLLPSWATIAEAWRRHRLERAESASALELLVGIDSSPRVAEQGQEFVKGVIERAGPDGLRQLWNHEDGLPTPSELQAPGLWLERLTL